MPDELPEVPQSWSKLIERIIIALTLVASITSSIISGCNAGKIGTVQEHQEKNTQTLGEVKQSADQAKDHAKKLEAKIEGMQSRGP